MLYGKKKKNNYSEVMQPKGTQEYDEKTNQSSRYFSYLMRQYSMCHSEGKKAFHFVIKDAHVKPENY